MKLTVGKIRGLQRIATPGGIFTMYAMDHRGSLKEMINKEHPEQVTYDEMVTRKLELSTSLAGYASAVLLDPVFGAAQCISQGALPRETGLLVSIEATGYTGSKEKRLTELLKGWSVEKIKRMGAQAVKMLVYYRADIRDAAERQLATIKTVADDCIKYDIPFVLEAVSYPVGDEIGNLAKFAARREELVIQAARDITALPIDVLKSEFPADMGYRKDEGELLELCHKLSDASRVPWVILSQGVDYSVFVRQVELACRGGASGFLGGRAIWKEAASIRDAGERVSFLKTTAAERARKLNDVAARYAVPWYRKLGLSASRLTDIPENWYREY